MSRIELRLLVLAIIARVLFVAWLNLAPAEYRPGFAVVTPDSKGYLQLAIGVMNGKGYQFGGDHLGPTRIPPLFPYLLSVVGRLSLHPVAVGILNSLLGALTTVLLYRLALRVFPGNPRIAVVSAGIYAVYPHVLLASTRILKEPFSIFLLVAFALAWAHTLANSSRISSELMVCSCLTGFLLGLSILSRYLHLGLLCMLLATHALLFIAGSRLKVSRKAVTLSAALAALVALLTISPWLYRNYVLTGELVLSTHGPMRYLYNSNSPLARPETWGYYEAKTVGGEEWDRRARELALEFNSEVPDRDPDKLLHPAILGEGDSFSEQERKFARAAALGTTTHPGHILSLMWGKLVNTWRPVWQGSSKLTWLAIGLPHIALMILALPGLGLLAAKIRQERRAELLVPMMTAIFYFLAHAVFYGMIRSRLYAIPFLCLLAALSLERAVVWWKARR